MPRLTLTDDEFRHLNPILEKYRAKKAEVDAQNHGLNLASNIVLSEMNDVQEANRIASIINDLKVKF